MTRKDKFLKKGSDLQIGLQLVRLPILKLLLLKFGLKRVPLLFVAFNASIRLARPLRLVLSMSIVRSRKIVHKM
jgi:hypothetical protein